MTCDSKPFCDDRIAELNEVKRELALANARIDYLCSPDSSQPEGGLINAAREVVAAFADADYTVTRRQNNAIGQLAGFVLMADRSTHPEGAARMKLQGFLDVVEAMKDAYWYDKEEKRHPAIGPLIAAYAEEVRAFLLCKPQGELSK